MHKQLQNLIVNDFKYAIAIKAEIAYKGLKLKRTFPEMLPTVFFFQYRSVVRHYHSGQKTTIEMHFQVSSLGSFSLTSKYSRHRWRLFYSWERSF